MLRVDWKECTIWWAVAHVPFWAAHDYWHLLNIKSIDFKFANASRRMSPFSEIQLLLHFTFEIWVTMINSVPLLFAVVGSNVKFNVLFSWLPSKVLCCLMKFNYALVYCQVTFKGLPATAVLNLSHTHIHIFLTSLLMPSFFFLNTKFTSSLSLCSDFALLECN